MSILKLGALDFSVVYPGMGSGDAIWETLDLAPRLEAFGYSRFWMAEHHTNVVAHSCPEIMTSLIAGLTTRMRIGTAGILLRLHSPLKVAATFRLLNAVFPGRIDLGLARGYATAKFSKYFSGSEDKGDAYEVRVDALLNFLRGTGEVVPSPAGIGPPEIWLLGTTSESARLAASFGTAFCLGMFLDMNGTKTYDQCMADYRYHFQPSRELPEPKCAVAVAGICAETRELAEALLAERAESEITVRSTIVGDPMKCHQSLRGLSETFCTDEIIFLDLCKDFTTRVRSYQLLAQVSGLYTTNDVAIQPIVDIARSQAK